MKKLLFIAILLLPTFIKAQQYVPFPDSNAVWSEQEFYQGSCDPPNYCKYQFRILGDTNINSIQYHKIYKLNDSLTNYSNEVYYGALREQGKKIYFQLENCQNEVLLYDFTKNVGDTLKNLYTSENINPCLVVSGYSIIINSIDSILIDGNYRKVFIIGSNTKWIEGIGSIYGLFNSISPGSIISCFCSWDLVCFHQNNTVKYLNPNFSTCFPIMDDISSYNFDNTSILIYPNPVTGSSSIKWNDTDNHTYSTLTISDILGRNIKTINVSGKCEVTINKNDFTQGLYFAKLITTKGENDVIKLIIQ